MSDFKSEGVLGETLFVITNPGLKAVRIELFTLYLGKFFLPSEIHKLLNKSHDTYFFTSGAETQTKEGLTKTSLLQIWDKKSDLLNAISYLMSRDDGFLRLKKWSFLPVLPGLHREGILVLLVLRMPPSEGKSHVPFKTSQPSWLPVPRQASLQASPLQGRCWSRALRKFHRWQ